MLIDYFDKYKLINWKMLIHYFDKYKLMNQKMLIHYFDEYKIKKWKILIQFFDIQIHKLKNADPLFWQIQMINWKKCTCLHKSDKHLIYNLEA